MDPLHHLPLTEIAPHALLRDRTALDPQALQLLQHSIAAEGLRTPIEVWRLSTPRDQHTYGLISGLRRLTACRALGHTTIPAFLRAPQTIAQALASMVTENEIREPVTPWEKATLILNAIHEGHFDTPDTAIAALFPAPPQTPHRAAPSLGRALQRTMEAIYPSTPPTAVRLSNVARAPSRGEGGRGPAGLRP